jgi:hypothetical protein
MFGASGSIKNGNCRQDLRQSAFRHPRFSCPVLSYPDFSQPLSSCYCPDVLTGTGAFFGVEMYPLI